MYLTGILCLGTLLLFTNEACLAIPTKPTSDLVPPAAKRMAAQARTQWLAGQIPEAEKSWHQANEIAPEWPVPVAGLAAAHQAQGRDTEAHAAYARVQTLSLGPIAPEANDNQLTLRKLILTQEANLCFLINRERLACRLRLLLPDVALARVARAHSEEMRDLRYYGHESPTPGNETVVERFLAIFKLQPRCIAENLARRYGLSSRLDDERVESSHRGLMASSGHRANILHPDFEVMGIGLAANLGEEYWITEVFVQFRE